MTPHPLTDSPPAPTSSWRRWVLPASIAVILVAATAVTTWNLTRPDGPAAAPVAPAVIPASPIATFAAPTTSPPSTVNGPHELGDRVVFTDGSGDATVLEFRQPVGAGADAPTTPGTVWAGAKVRTCSRAEVFTVSEDPWSLTYADGGIVEPSNGKYNEFPAPEYPVLDRTVPVGRCVSGWIVFPALKGQRPAAVSYTPEDEPVPLEWAIP